MLKCHLVNEVPCSAYYIPNFISKEHEADLIKRIYQSPKPKWTCLLNRRLQNWGGLPHPKGMVQEKIPYWLNNCCRLVSETEAFDSCLPNHILVNEYKPGQGIMPHKDGPLYFPTVTTINLGCHTLLDFYKALENEEESPSRYEFSLFLEPRSLLVLKHSLYKEYLHGIADTSVDEIDCNLVKNRSAIGDENMRNDLMQSEHLKLPREETRISLTIRNVPKTIKFKFKT